MLSIAGVLLVAVAGLIGAAWVLAGMLFGPPSWYDPPAAGDAAVEGLGEQVEYRLVEELQRVRPAAERWTVRLTDAQANAWLAARLPSWWRSRTGEAWPPEIRAPQVRTSGEQLVIAIEAELPGLDAGLVAVVRPVGRAVAAGAADAADSADAAADADDASTAVDVAPGLGRVGLELVEARVGRGAGPPGAATELVLDAAGVEPADAARIRAALDDPASWIDGIIEDLIDESPGSGGRSDGRAGVPLELADGRRVRLVAIGLEAGALTFRFVAEAAGAAGE